MTDAKGNIINPELFMCTGKLTVVRDISTAASVLSDADIIVLQTEDEQWLRGVIKAVKAQPALFLKPLLLLSECSLDGLDGLADEVAAPPASRSMVSIMIATLLPVARKAAALSPLPDTDRLKELLLLQFLYLRDNRPLKPARDISSRVGYSYPLVQVLLNTPPGEDIYLLDELAQSSLLENEFVDKVNICPKCYKCTACGRYFGEPALVYHCLNCSCFFAPEEALIRTIYVFTLRHQGIQPIGHPL